MADPGIGGGGGGGGSGVLLAAIAFLIFGHAFHKFQAWPMYMTLRKIEIVPKRTGRACALALSYIVVFFLLCV